MVLIHKIINKNYAKILIFETKTPRPGHCLQKLIILAFYFLIKALRLSLNRQGVFDIQNVKYIEDDIWELRPLRDRILFAYYDKNKFILLSIFMKTTRKTPKIELEKAKKLLKDWSDRNEKWKMGNVGGV